MLMERRRQNNLKESTAVRLVWTKSGIVLRSSVDEYCEPSRDVMVSFDCHVLEERYGGFSTGPDTTSVMTKMHCCVREIPSHQSLMLTDHLASYNMLIHFATFRTLCLIHMFYVS